MGRKKIQWKKKGYREKEDDIRRRPYRKSEDNIHKDDNERKKRLQTGRWWNKKGPNDIIRKQTRTIYVDLK